MDRIQGLQLFVRVCETGSLTRAATDLGVTQPTATKHIAQLEKRLGARLFHRSTRGVTPTEVGAAYYDRCKAIALQLEEADHLPALMSSRVQGTLRINSSVAFGRRVLVPMVLRYMQHFKIDHDRMNVCGGAIAMGHPLGATGAMILGTVLDELERRNKSTALVTLCIGAGMGTATIIERV
jgi:DNA-binding transcriptional LysR family regulator